MLPQKYGVYGFHYPTNRLARHMGVTKILERGCIRFIMRL
jgi:hypothetical protein